MKKPFLLSALLLATGGTAASAEILVVRSVGPSAKLFPPGKSLPDNIQMSLKAGDVLVVLDGRGTRTLKGPGSFSPSAPAQATRTAMAAATPAPQRRARIGAVRGIESGPSDARPATLWHVDVKKSSNICLAEKGKATLWRADAAKPVTLTIARSGAAAHKVEWPAGEANLSWPSEIEMVEGADYNLTWDGAAQPTRLKFKTLPSKPVGLEDTASLLIKNGCDAQLDHLIETVKVPEEPAPAG
jgi:hypothetical protein